MKEKITLIVFSLSTSLEKLISCLNTRPKGELIVCLSPHVVFNDELEIIKNEVDVLPIFESFYQYISEEEMVYCDTYADELIVNKFSNRSGRLNEYYQYIKKIKNELIYKNIQEKYSVDKCMVLARDLGIYPEVFTKKKEKIKKKSVLESLQLITFSFKKLISPINIVVLNAVDHAFYLIGNHKRVAQYLDCEKYSLSTPRAGFKVLIWLMIKISLIKKLNIPIFNKLVNLLLNINGFVIKNIFKNYNFPLMTSIHEHNDSYGEIAKKISVQYINIQDGYLPTNYPSTYLKYRVGVDLYYIWDSLSSGIFSQHNLEYYIWDIFQKNKIRPENVINNEIKQVLFLTSGSGDWTAIKNRSDEDLAFLAYCDLAVKFENIKFIYRPHPLWVHPDHQGVRSIQRVHEYVNNLSIDNLIVSAGALAEGVDFAKNKQLSNGSASIGDEISASNIIFGDHSQVLLTAAEEGKIVASVNFSNRSSLFSGHTELEFPLLQSLDDMKEFMKGVTKGDLSSFNTFIEKYNDR